VKWKWESKTPKLWRRNVYARAPITASGKPSGGKMGNKINGDAIENGIISLKDSTRGGFHYITKKILEVSSPLARDVFYHGPGSWQALRTIYEDNPKGFERVIYPLTLGLAGARDTRNRLDTYTNLIKELLERGELSGNGYPCEFIDLACGCSLGPIRAAEKVKRETEDPAIHIKCSDKMEDAIKESKINAEKYGVSHLMDFDVYKVSEIGNKEPPEGYDGVGTHGIIDYFDSQKAVNLFKKIGGIMKPRATVITTNMKKKEKSNTTRKMMEFYGEWFTNNKTEEELGNILYDAGFDDINVWETPLGYHLMATGKKRG